MTQMDELRRRKRELLQYLEKKEQGGAEIDPSRALSIKMELVKIHRKLRNYDEAVVYLKEILAAKEKRRGKENIDVLKLKNALIDLYIKQGFFKEADALLGDVIRTEAMAYPDGNSTTLMSVYYLAILRREQAKYRDAEFLLKKILELNEKIPRRQRVSPFTIKSALANLYWKQDLYADAGALCQDLLMEKDEIEKSTLLEINRTLVDIFMGLEEYEKAKEICVKLLGTKKRLLGMKHPETLLVTNTLAQIHMCLGDYNKAEKICRDILTIQEKVLDSDHLDILSTKSTLADVLRKQRKLSQARDLHQEVLEARKRKLGEEHHDTVESMNRLGLAYVSWDQFDKAGECLFEALLISEGYSTEDDMLNIVPDEFQDSLVSIGGTDYQPGFFSAIFSFLGKKEGKKRANK